MLSALGSGMAHADSQIDIAGPVGSGSFGTIFHALPNGNLVVTDPNYSIPGGAVKVGAVYLYDGVTHSLISQLTGSQTNDRVGAYGVTVLTNGNYFIESPDWDNGTATDAGAVTWCSGTSGVSGVVSASNSLVGSRANDQVGSNDVTVLTNGNYVVRSPKWDNGPAADAGAVTWGSGMSGVSGVVSVSNSLVGSTAGDQVGTNTLSAAVTALTNGNYVVNSPRWDSGGVNEAGAVTWCNGATGLSGVISAANSLVGSAASDEVGIDGVMPLTNGNYIVRSSLWDNGAAVNAGAATWGNGEGGIIGVVSAANSLVGSTTDDRVGESVRTLPNGNYIIASQFWDNGAVTNAGAVTWSNGTSGITGAISAGNSVIGTSTNDQIGSQGVFPLTNSNYVIISAIWNNGAATKAGAVTWGNGATGSNGEVSAGNSLVGSTTGDQVGSGNYPDISGVTVLPNGNYVVSSQFWDNGAMQNVGAVTWGNGVTGTSGAVSLTNSLVGSQTGDQVGRSGVTALTIGNYVVKSPLWDNGTTQNVGAVTWGNGASGITGTVSAANSLVGSTTTDSVGNGAGSVTALSDGSYVAISPNWNNGATVDVGAVTWGNGSSGISGAVSAANSLIGSQTSDFVGSSGVSALMNGSCVVRSPLWDNGAVTDAGAVTWMGGGSPFSGVVSPANSLVGSSAFDKVGGSGGVKVLSNGNYVIRSVDWDNPSPPGINVGAITYSSGAGGTTGPITSYNSVLGTPANGGSRIVYEFDLANNQLVVGRPAENLITLFRLDPSGTLRITSITKPSNSQVLIQGMGVPTLSYPVEATEDLVQPFLTIGTTTMADANGSFQYIDNTTLPRRFYRIVDP